VRALVEEGLGKGDAAKQARDRKRSTLENVFSILIFCLLVSVESMSQCFTDMHRLSWISPHTSRSQCEDMDCVCPQCDGYMPVDLKE
jgi:hypothetical protein